MRIYVMCDLEGVAGVVNHRKQCWFDGEYYHQARRLATLELNALVQGALAGGATDIVAWDGHGGFPGGLDVELLHPACKMAMETGNGGPAGLDNTYDAVLQLGLHGMASARLGVLAHSFDMSLRGIWLNGREIGEIAMNCLTAGQHGVPCIMLAGDQAAVEEARAIVPEIETVSVKYGLAGGGCVSVAPEKAREMIREGARRAMAKVKSIKPFFVEPPYVLRAEYKEAKSAEQSASRPGVRRVGVTTVETTGNRLEDLSW